MPKNSSESRHQSARSARATAAWIACVYLVVGVGWLLASDFLIVRYMPGVATNAYETAGDWAFVMITAGILFWAIRRDIEKKHRGFAEEIAARRVAEEARVISEARLRLALEYGHVGTWSWDLTTGGGECDEGLARVLGCSRDQLVGGGMEFFMGRVHPEDRAPLARLLEEARRNPARGEYVAEYRFYRPDGAVLWVADRARIERDARGRALRMIGISMDITANKAAQAALAETENRFREVVEAIREVFWIVSANLERVIYVSPGYEVVWGRTCAELYASPRSWIDAIDPEDRERVVRALANIETTGTYDETYRVARPDGSTRWIRDHGYPVRDETGGIARIVGTAEDITDRKKLEGQFLHAQRLEAVGTLASGVAHDLNNILAPIFMIGPLLKPKLDGLADRKLLDIVEHSAMRGAGVVRQLLSFGRGLSGEHGPIQVRHLIKEMVAIMHETFPREIEITQQIPGDLWAVIGDATQFHQVLINLCVNARDAMPSGGRLQISARNTLLTADDLLGQPGVKPGPFVILSVADTGHGIPPEALERIFEPFFTTKPIGKGTGLGLSTVLGIVRTHGGFVTVETDAGRGASFRVHLPAAADAVESEAAGKLASTPAAAAGELVLVVDDEPAVCATTKQILEKYGYRVVTATNGREGVASFLRHRSQVRAVVTDLMMPEMGGVALAHLLKELDPELPIVVITGLEGENTRADLAAVGVTELMIKPFTPFQLMTALERGIEQTRGGQPVPSDRR